jgi:hypothetical protein
MEEYQMHYNPLWELRSLDRHLAEEKSMPAANPWGNSRPEPVNWMDYRGFELVTSDQISLGIVEQVLIDDRTGETFLRIVNPVHQSKPLNVPTRFIGVITRRRLMLDVTSANLGRLELDRYNSDRPPTS